MVVGDRFEYRSFLQGEAVIGTCWSRLRWLGWEVLFVYLKGFRLGLGEPFPVDLGLPPKGGVGLGHEGWGNASPDGGVKGIRVEVR